jgi:hypothetical protein
MPPAARVPPALTKWWLATRETCSGSGHATRYDTRCIQRPQRFINGVGTFMDGEGRPSRLSNAISRLVIRGLEIVAHER